MKKISLKIIGLFLLILIIFSASYVFAQDKTNPIDTLQHSIHGPEGNALAEMDKLSGKIYTVMLIIGTGCSIIGIMVLGIKYITSSPNDRAEIKKHLAVFGISAVIFFGATGIIGLIETFGSEIFKKAF